jgi:hypothetical protein
VDCLLVVVILEDLLEELLNFYLLLLNHIVDDSLHPGKVGVHVSTLLAFDVLGPVEEVVLFIELSP